MLKSLLSALENPVAECSVVRSLRSKLRIYSKEAIYVQNQCGRYLLVKWEFSKILSDVDSPEEAYKILKKKF